MISVGALVHPEGFVVDAVIVRDCTEELSLLGCVLDNCQKEVETSFCMCILNAGLNSKDDFDVMCSHLSADLTRFFCNSQPWQRQQGSA